MALPGALISGVLSGPKDVPTYELQDLKTLLVGSKLSEDEEVEEEFESVVWVEERSQRRRDL